MHLLDMRSARRQHPLRGHSRYAPPGASERIALSELLRLGDRSELESKQLDMLRRGETTSGKDIVVHFAGNVEILRGPAVAIVGSGEAVHPR